ncbi:MAG: hypothetical protein FWC50_01795 [Planctomycetaceae bacterium]|nr:hypothetical protein [Planctomycetaceae bacterium]
MSRPFSLPTLLRMTPNTLLAEFFRRFDVELTPDDWKKLGEREIDPILKFFDELPDVTKNELEAAMRNIFALATREGLAAFHEAAAGCHKTDWKNGLEKITPYSASMHVWLHDPELFESAMAVCQFSHLPWWRRRAHLPLLVPEFTDKRRQSLKAALEKFFDERQGRGRVCTVDLYDRGNGVYYYTAHPDDYLEEVLVHDEQHNLKYQIFCKTFDVVLAYDRRHGFCDLYAKVPPSLKPDLEQLFLEEILQDSVSQYEPPPFDLLPLLDPDFSLKSALEFRVNVSVSNLVLGWGDGELVYKYRIYDSPYKTIRQAYNQELFPVDDAEPHRAKIRMIFPAVQGKKEKSMTFEIGVPNSCSLRNQPQEYMSLAHQLLQHWGIEHAETPSESALPMGK